MHSPIINKLRRHSPLAPRIPPLLKDLNPTIPLPRRRLRNIHRHRALMRRLNNPIRRRPRAMAPLERDDIARDDADRVGRWEFAEDVALEVGEGEVFDGPGACTRVGAVDEGGFAGAWGAVHRGWADTVVGPLVYAIDVNTLFSSVNPSRSGGMGRDGTHTNECMSVNDARSSDDQEGDDQAVEETLALCGGPFCFPCMYLCILQFVHTDNVVFIRYFTLPRVDGHP